MTLQLVGKLLLYTRSVRNDDYHWVYKDNEIDDKDIANIAYDHYQMTSNWGNLELTLKQKSLYVRRLESLNGFAIYKLFNTNIRDSCGSTIFALCGMTFTGFQGQRFHDLLVYIASYLFRCFESYTWQTKYKERNTTKSFSINLEEIFNSNDNLVQDAYLKLKNYLFNNNCESGFRLYTNGFEVRAEDLNNLN